MSRAVGMMVLITECHPFDDGNGRIARLMANAELSVAGQVRVVIPTSFRNNYLAALSALSSGNGDGQSLHAVMDFAQRWVAHMDWATFERADEQVRATNGYLDPAESEGSGRRLRLPT
jgi:Fic family protein